MSIKALLVPPLNRPPVTARLPELPAGTAIPRILHQTYFSCNLPERLHANVQRLQAMNPDWEYRFYTDEDIEAFIKTHYPPLVWDYYQRIDANYGAARADLFRYLLIYKVGGVYLDIKSSASRPFDEVLHPDDRFILSKWHNEDGSYAHQNFVYDLRHLPGEEFQQWHVIGAPGHPFLKAVLEQVLTNMDAYDPYLHQTGKRGVLRLTGPIAYTLAIERIRNDHPHRVVDGRNAFGLEYSVYDGFSGHEQAFRQHYRLQTSPIVKLRPARRALSQMYRLAQFAHDRLRPAQ
jgi:hypothetical protein